MVKKVKCIDNNGCEDCLTEGKMYEVLEESKTTYLIIYDEEEQCWFLKNFFEPASEKTLDDLEKGDIVEIGCGNFRKVLARLEDIVFLSWINRYNKLGARHLIQELKDKGYTLKQEEVEEPEVKEVTMSEVCKKFGEEVKIVKG